MEKQRLGRAREEKRRREKIREEKESEEIRCRCGKVAIHCVLPVICGSRGSKSRLAKAAGRKSARLCGTKHISKSKKQNTLLEALLEVEMSKKCTPLWHEAHFEVKINKAHCARSTFGS